MVVGCIPPKELSITHKLGVLSDHDMPGSGQVLKSLPATPDGGNARFAV